MARSAIANARYFRNRPSTRSRARNVAHYVVIGSSAAGGRELGGYSGWGEELSAAEVMGRVEEIHENSEFTYTMVLSPVPGAGHGYSVEQWRQFTEESLESVNYGGNWVAVMHDDPEHPHVHVVMGSDRRLTAEQLSDLNRDADRSAEAIAEFSDVREFLADLERERHHQRDLSAQVGVNEVEIKMDWSL